MATNPIGGTLPSVTTSDHFSPAAAALMAARLLDKHSPHEIAEAVEILIDVLDLIGGDPDAEEDNEDCCPARDDAGSFHPNDSYGDGLPGDPLDAEPDDFWGGNVI